MRPESSPQSQSSAPQRRRPDGVKRRVSRGDDEVWSGQSAAPSDEFARLLSEAAPRVESRDGAMVRGVLTQHVMEAVSQEMFGGDQGRELIEKTLPQIQSSTTMPSDQKRLLAEMLGSVQKFYRDQPASGAQGTPQRRGLTMPYTVREEAMTAGSNIEYNGYAHSFAGMSVQFILFAGIDAGVLLLLLRGRGIWQRIRSAPLHKSQFLFARATATMLISLFTLTVVYAVAMVVFGVRIDGSLPGFIAIAIAFCG